LMRGTMRYYSTEAMASISSRKSGAASPLT